MSELLRLVDDTSNDFAFTDSQQAVDAVIRNRGSRVAVDPVVPVLRVTVSCRSGFAVHLVSNVPSPTGNDLLRSVCIQRV